MRKYLTANKIYQYLMGDEKLETLICCNPDNIDLMTTDQSLYEAIGSITKKEEVNISKLVKLLEIVNILSFKYSLGRDRKILSNERVCELTDRGEKSCKKKR